MVIKMEFILENSLGFILSRANIKLKIELLQQFKEYDVTTEQWSILNCLWAKEGITPKELASTIGKDKPNTNRILEKLENKQLIARQPHPTDKRSFIILLTESGWALKDELISKAMQLLEKATKGIEKEKVLELKNMLNQIFENLS